jgi:hypothetical protein
MSTTGIAKVMERASGDQAAFLHLFTTVLDRLANGDAFNVVVEETGITARIRDASKQFAAGNVAIKLLEETDEYLRDIRAENLDGSEPELSILLDQVTAFWIKQDTEQVAALVSGSPPGEEAARKPAFVTVQGAGDGTDLTVHTWSTQMDAEDDRIACAADGIYGTSEVLEVPGCLAEQPDFYRVAEAIVQAAATVKLNQLVCAPGDSPEPC